MLGAYVSLRGRFKEFRCEKKDRPSIVSTSESEQSKVVRGQAIQSALPVPEGEDDVSF